MIRDVEKTTETYHRHIVRLNQHAITAESVDAKALGSTKYKHIQKEFNIMLDKAFADDNIVMIATSLLKSQGCL